MFVDLNFGEGLHTVSVVGNWTLIVLLAKEYKVYGRIKERVNQMYREYCDAHNIPYESVDK